MIEPKNGYAAIDYLNIIAENIHRLRGKMSQEDLAKKAQIARGTITRAEKGLPISLKNLSKIADALGVSLATLFISDAERMEFTNKLEIRFKNIEKELEKLKRGEENE